MALGSFAQYHAMTKKLAHKPPLSSTGIDLPVAGEQTPNPLVSSKSVMDDPVTCVTRYDLQSNYTSQRGFTCTLTGTIGTVATWSDTGCKLDRSWQRLQLF